MKGWKDLTLSALWISQVLYSFFLVPSRKRRKLWRWLMEDLEMEVEYRCSLPNLKKVFFPRKKLPVKSG